MDRHTGNASMTLREELTAQSGHDPILRRMLAHNLPLDRETYLALAYPDGEPEHLGVEQELEIPEPLRRR